MLDLYNQLGAMGIVPVVVIDDENQAEPLAEALTEAGLPCAEITFRTAAAAGAIRRIAASYPLMLVGAGTVLNVEQAKKAVDSGAKFIVSPGTNRKVLEFCARTGVPAIPGVVTPSEIMTALELGHTVVKFFPAEACGGIT
jgi:2-dehydro-3-deoxyphosphogluconate aldolase/(4S)-4-hydroxy-2-oxoglutarate aldolase